MAQPSIGFAVKGFWTAYEPQKDGTAREVDYVEFGPVGALDRTLIVEKVARISRVAAEGAAEQNPAVGIAAQRWAIIEPLYRNWKAGRETPESGTPLAAWNRLSPPQADTLRLKGIRTVEEVAALTDSHIERFGLPNLRDIIADARRFLAAQSTGTAQAQMASLEAENAALKADQEEMRELLNQLLAEKKAGEAPAPEAAEGSGTGRRKAA